MDRLIYSSPLPSKSLPNPRFLRPRFNQPTIGLLPLSRAHFKPLGSFLSKQEDPPSTYSALSAARFSTFCFKSDSHSTSPAVRDLPQPHPFTKLIGGRDPQTLLRKEEFFSSVFWQDRTSVLISFSVVVYSVVTPAFSVFRQVRLWQDLPSGAIIFLSALIALLIQPLIASQASATVQTAARTGGSTAAIVGGKLIRSELLSSAWTGFFAGCLHTLSGPDHLAALAPLSIGRSRLESAAVGALWGCGHDAGQVIFGLLFLLLKDRLHIEIIRTWGTRVVGLTLLVIGAMGIREASEIPTPCVALENGDCDVSMIKPLETPKKKIGFATFATGIVHGLQPDALMMVLPALALPSRMAGAAFLGMFLLGTVFAMGSYTVFIGSCSQALKDRIPRITEKLTWVSSLVAIALGMAIIISQFFGFSLY